MRQPPIPDSLPAPPLGTPWESYAVDQLQERLRESAELMANCLEVAAAKDGDRVGGLSAAARIMQANAQVAEMLQRLVRGESRRRTIVERIQKLAQPAAELNSKKSPEEIRASLAKLVEEACARDAAERERLNLNADPDAVLPDGQA